MGTGNASIFEHSSGRILAASENSTNSDLKFLVWTAIAAEGGFYPGKKSSQPETAGLKPIKETTRTGINDLKPGKESSSIPYVMPHRIWNAKAAEEIDGRKYVIFKSGRTQGHQIRVYETDTSLLSADSWAI